MEETLFVSFDIGTQKVCSLVGQLDNAGRIRILGLGIVPSHGMRKGGVVNLEGVAQSIMAAKEKAERTSGYEITSALVNLSGSQIASMNSTGMAGVSGRTIGPDDVRRALEAAQSMAIPYNREVVHVIPRGFVIDGQDGIKDAIGMHGYRLEVEAHIVTSATTARRNLEKCVEASGMVVDGWVLSSLAAGQLVLTDTEREMGVVICDVGAGTTDLAIYIEGSVWHTAVIPVGGDHITSDISQGLHLPLDTAESIKQRHGNAMKALIESSQAFTVRPFGSDKPIQIRRTELSSIIEARAEEIFSLVRQEIKRSGYDGLLPAGIVLTGGTRLLPGIRELAVKVLHLPVRLAQPENVLGLADELKSPAFSTSLGMLCWARMQEEDAHIDSYRYGPSWPSIDLRQATNFLKRLLPG
ncbi:MAG: cell division protein FtsA [Anaerolineales bacterium]|nr:cell division protein FtsA [Anaerolineales bacterium]